MHSAMPSQISTAPHYAHLRVTSTAFADGELLPAKYTCDGLNASPPLDIDGIPPEATCLSIMMIGTYDGREEWAHWLAWNIPPIKHIEEGRKMEIEGLNYFDRKKYDGPCPSGGLHYYYFKVYALSDCLPLHSATTKRDLELAMATSIIGYGELRTYYQRSVIKN